MDNIVYISDNFFSSGTTYIRDSNNQEIGKLDLKSMFHSGVSVSGTDDITIASGRFNPLSNQWMVFNQDDEQLGIVKTSFFSFSKKYFYTAFDRGRYLIHSPAFSRSFIVYDEQNNEIATFNRINSFFTSAAYEINLSNDAFTMEELIIVVMGVNAIEKQKRANSGAAGGS